MTEYRTVARNPARASENRIHDDEVAKAHGFRGGLVPGVTVYAYACSPIVEAFGADFLDKGSARIRFLSPIYDGDEVTARVGAGGEVAVSVGDRTCASGEVTIGESIDRPDIASAVPPEPEDRPPASEEAFRPGRVLGSFQLLTDPATVGAYLESIGDQSPLYLDRGWVHPGLILSAANWVLGANAVMPAWIHTESHVQHARAVQVGESVEVRAVVAEEFERKGHRHLALDVLWLASGQPAAWARHRAIWSLGA